MGSIAPSATTLPAGKPCSTGHTSPPLTPAPSTPAPSMPPQPVQSEPAGAGDATQRAQLVAALQQVSTALQALITALQGQLALGAPPTQGTQGVPATPASSAPLSGFTVTGDANDQALIGQAMAQIGTTSVGAQLLNATRNQGVQLDIVDDATFQARSGSTTAVGVFIGSTNAAPTVLVRASALKSSNDLPHVLAHELVHAAQWVGGERSGAYQRALGANASGLSADQLKVGDTLMSEAGAEFVASSIVAQLQDPVRFAEVAKTKLDTAAAANWQSVSEVRTSYNPQGYQLPQAISPIAQQLVRAGLGV